MGEYSPYNLDDFSYEVLQLYIKYGYGMFRMYENTFFHTCLTNETVTMTMEEFFEKVKEYRDSQLN